MKTYNIGTDYGYNSKILLGSRRFNIIYFIYSIVFKIDIFIFFVGKLPVVSMVNLLSNINVHTII